MDDAELNIDALQVEANKINKEVVGKRQSSEDLSDQEIADEIINGKSKRLVDNVERLASAARAKVQRSAIDGDTKETSEKPKPPEKKSLKIVTTEDQINKMRDRKVSWFEGIRTNMDLRDAGIVDRKTGERVRAVLDFVADEIPTRIFRSIKVPKKKAALTAIRLEREGFKLQYQRDVEGKPGMADLTFEKLVKSKARVSNYDLQTHVIGLVSKLPDPVRVLNLVNNVTALDKEAVTGYKSDYLIKLAQIPKNLGVLEILEKAGITIKLRNVAYTAFDSGADDFGDVLDGVEIDDETSARAREISETLSGDISESEVGNLFRVAKSGESVELMDLLIQSEPMIIRGGGLLRGLSFLERQGLTSKVIFAVQNGITVPGLSGRGIFGSYFSEFDERQVTDYFSKGNFEDIEQDPGLAEFVQVVGQLTSELNINDISDLYKNYDADKVIAILEAISEAKIFMRSSVQRIKTIMAEPMLLDILLDDDFIAFTNDLVQQGAVEPGYEELINQYSENTHSGLFDVFQDPELRDRVQSEAGIKAIAINKFLPRTINSFKELMNVAESPELVNLMQELRDLKIYVNFNGPIVESLKNLLNDPITIKAIRDNDFSGFLEGVNGNSYVSLTLGSQEFSNILSFFGDGELRSQLVVPENIAFLRAVLLQVENNTPETLKLILTLDRDAREFCLRLKKAYGFSFGMYQLDAQATIEKMKELQTDEEKVAKLFDPERQIALQEHFGNDVFAAAEYVDVPIPVLNFLKEFKRMEWSENGYFRQQYGGQDSYPTLVSLLSENEELLPALSQILGLFKGQDLLRIDSVNKLIPLVEHLIKYPETSLTNATKISVLKELRDKFHVIFDENPDSLELMEKTPENAFERLHLVGEKTGIDFEDCYVYKEVLYTLISKQEALCELCDLLANEGIIIEKSSPSSIYLPDLKAFLRDPAKSVEKYKMLFGESPLRFDHLHGSTISIAVYKDISKDDFDTLMSKHQLMADSLPFAIFCDLTGATKGENNLESFFWSTKIREMLTDNPGEIENFKKLYDVGLLKGGQVTDALVSRMENRGVVLSYVARVNSEYPENSWFLLDDYALVKIITSPEKTDNMFRLAKYARDENVYPILKYFDTLASIDDQIIDKAIKLLGDLVSFGSTPGNFLDKLATNPELIDRFSNLVDLARNSTEGKKRLLTDPKIIAFVEANADFVDQLTDLDVPDDQRVIDLCISKLPEVLAIPQEKREAYLNIILKIAESPSQEIKLLVNEIMTQILATDNPERTYEVIESVFVKNNLPLVGKIYKVFSILNSPELLQGKSISSPVLNRLKPNQRRGRGEAFYAIIFRDLMKCHLYSGNRSLREYLEVLQGSEEIFDKLESREELTETELDRAQKIIVRLKTIYENSQLGERQVSEGDYPSFEGDPDSIVVQLRESLVVHEGQSINDRLAEMFLRPLGYSNFNEALLGMREIKRAADARNRKFVEESNGVLNCKDGDYIKGLNNVTYLPVILQNGSVAKEFLGGSASSDSTPLDTDVSRVRESDGRDFQTILMNSMAVSYGLISCVFRNRGQFSLTDSENKKYLPDKYEVFSSGGDQHYGIRTGIPASEIDFLVLDVATGGINEESRNKIYFEIAQNGFYIPVTDRAGKVIFTPEMYDQYRRIFDGLTRFDGNDFRFISTEVSARNFQEIDKIKRDFGTSRVETERVNQGIITRISAVLEEFGIAQKHLDRLETGLLGAELYNTGSTGRYTNQPGDYDFDFALRLDEKDMTKAISVANRLREVFSPQRENSSSGQFFQQLRFVGATAVDKLVDIDIGIVAKSELKTFSTNEAVEERLNWIGANIGEEAYAEVVANIVLAKRILADAHAYKRYEDGGFGGIGVENWILQNNGNIREAMNSFWEASHNEAGGTISLDQFIASYRIIDPGVNLRQGQNLATSLHDNYTANLKPEGYQKMVDAIGRYLGHL